MNPKISIITVCYNCAKTIEKTIKSVLSQTYSNIEYIVIDGKSNDGTVDIIHRYERSISFWISEPDGGIYEAMNKGIDAATGDIIGFINGDDYYADDAIKVIAKRYIETNADVIYGDLTFIDANGPRNDWKAPEDLSDFYCGMVIPHPSTFCKTILLKRYKMDMGYKIASDYKLLLQLYHDKMKFVHIDKVIAFFYTGGVSGRKLYGAAKETYNISKSVIKGNSFLERKYLSQIEKKYRDAIANLIFNRACKYGYTQKWMKYELGKGDDLYVFGTGEIAFKMYDFLTKSNLSIQGFLDNNKSLHGKKIRSIEIFPPSMLSLLDKGKVIISTTKYENEILMQLENMQLKDKIDIYTYSKMKKSICDDYLHDSKLFYG